MTVLIVETKFSGHHLFYVSLLVQASLASGDRVVVALSASARSSEEFDLHLAPLRREIEVVEAPDVLDWYVLLELQDRWCPRITVVPDGDRLVAGRVRAPRGSLRDTRVLVMRSSAQSSRAPALSPIKTALKRVQIWRNSRHSNVRPVMLRSSADAPRSGRGIAIDPVVFAPTATARARVRARLDTKGGQIKWVGVFGAITARKNVPLLTEALAFASDRPEKLGLVIAGSVAADDRAAVQAAVDSLRSQGVPVVLDDRRLSDNELDAYVELADCVALAHSNEGPSGLFGKALAAGTPVVAAGARSLRRDVARWPDRGEWVPLHSDALSSALVRATRTRAEPVFIAAPDQFTAALLGGRR